MILLTKPWVLLIDVAKRFVPVRRFIYAFDNDVKNPTLFNTCHVVDVRDVTVVAPFGSVISVENVPS